MTEGMRKLTLERTLDLEARHLHDQSRITHLTTDLRRAEYRLSQLNDYLDGEGVVVDWEDDEGEAGTSQVGTSGCRVAYPMNFKAVLDVLIESLSEKEDEEDIDESSTDYSDDDAIDAITMEILSNQTKIDELQEAESSGTRVGSVVGHKTINCSLEFYHKLLMYDYIRDKNVYGSEHLCRRFRMS
ncbi:hypothetical protein GIB67_004038 [Kingdonia uniflora]|uniref:Uncharacterized protein n=1 Tax=Kingdonia uniflora TaxID=39325 RepID=A0A7J7NR40_9MAGN|nr:hypothetical protein GIB67_004038 [Kingdonia uniflora]